MSLDRDGRQCMSAGITYSYCRLRPVLRDTDQFLQVAMGMKQWDCVSSSTSLLYVSCLSLVHYSFDDPPSVVDNYFLVD